MAAIINTTANAAMGNWQSLGVVMGIAVVKYDDLTIADDSIVERHGQRTRAAREAALERMNARAAQMGADAVVGIRFDNSVVNSTHAIRHVVEYTAYGTAVKLR